MSPELAQQIFGAPNTMALCVLAVLSALLLAAAWSDLQRQRIPNGLVFSGTLLAMVLHTVLPEGSGFLSTLPGGLGFGNALLGLFFGLVALLPLYFIRAMGAGDVKLLAMVGAFLGPIDIWLALLSTFIAGGLLAIFMALRMDMLGSALKNVGLMVGHFQFRTGPNLEPPVAGITQMIRMPYGVAIAGGCLAYLVLRVRMYGLV